MSRGPLPSCGGLLSGSSGLSALAWEGGRHVKEEQRPGPPEARILLTLKEEQQLCVLQRLVYF